MHIRVHPLFVAVSAIVAMAVVSSAHAFFDEVAKLQQELQVWDTAEAADLSDVVARLDDITGSVFRDVSDDAWYRPQVSFLAEASIVSGEKDDEGNATGYFRPTRNVTIAEALKMTLEAARVDKTRCPPQPEHATARSHWAAVYVACAETMDVRIVTEYNALALDRPARRGEVVSMVLDAFGDKSPPLYAQFSDTSGHPYEADIAYATLLDIVSGDTGKDGKPTGTFRPNDSINRAEVAKLVYERIKVDARRELAQAL